jgi:hypothetical protein
MGFYSYLNDTTLIVFLAVSLFFPRLFTAAYQLEDGILLLAFVSSRFLPNASEYETRIVKATVIFVAILFAVGFLAVAFVVLPADFYSSPEQIFREAGRLLKYLALVATLARLVGSPGLHEGYLQKALLAMLAVHVFFGLAQYFHFGPVEDFLNDRFLEDSGQTEGLTEEAIESGRFRANGTVYNANIYGCVAVFLGAAAWLCRRSTRVEVGLNLGLMTLAIFLSQSRTAFIGLCIAAYFLASDTKRRGMRLLFQSVAATTLVGATLSSTGMSQRMAEVLGGSAQEIVATRPQYQRFPGKILDESPAVGLGIGTLWELPPDSDFLYVLMQFGAIGVACVFGYYFYLMAYRPRRKRLALPGLAGMVCGLANGILFGNEVAPFLLLAITFAGCRGPSPASALEPATARPASATTDQPATQPNAPGPPAER